MSGDIDDFRGLLAKVGNGETLDIDEAERAFDIMTSGNATPAQMGAFLMGLKVRGETAQELAGGSRALRAKVLRVRAPEGAIDIVGTGGDHHGTYNVSSCSAFVVAGAGVPVAKHGNRAFTSKSGAADVLSALGIGLELPIEVLEKALVEANVCFLMAPRHHSAMRNVAGPRVELAPNRTIFNLLGPMSNPALVRRQLVGVFDRRWLRPVAEAMEFLTVKPGTHIIRERDRGDLMFVLHHGRVEVQKEDEAGSRRPVAQLGRGEVFGEIALLQQIPRTSSVVTIEATELFALKKADFDRLLLSTLGANKIQEAVQVCAFLRRNTIFADWPPHALMKVAGQFAFQDCAAGVEVLSEGRHNESFYIVYEGEFGVSKGGAQIATLGPGDFCGEISLLQGTAASANVAASRHSRCLRLGKENFLQLVSRDFLTGMTIERTSDERVVALKKQGGAK